MKLKCIISLTILLMSKPLVMVVPGQPSQIPTTGSMVEMYGNLQGKPQAYQAEMTAFVQKVNEVNRNVFQLNFDGKIVVKNTAFVMGNAVFGLSEVERFDLPFASIQDAINAITPGSLNWCIIVYPGSYFGNIVVPDELNMYFYGGVTVNGNIQLGNNTHLQFDCGSTVVGDITDAGISVNSVICGCLVHEGQITLTGANTELTAHGDQMWKANITDATFNCYFGRIKQEASSAILGFGTSKINVYGLVAPVFGYNISIISFRGSVLTVRDCDFDISGTASGIFLDDGVGYVYNTRIRSSASPSIDVLGSGELNVFDCQLESLQDYAAETQNTSKLVIRRSHLTVANSLSANMDAILISVASSLVLEGNTIIAKGTGASVLGTGAVVIKSLIGNGSNAAVDGATITESVSNIFVDVLYE